MVSAWLDLHQGNIEACQDKIRRALQSANDQSHIMINAGDLYAAIGFADSAAALYRSALETNPDDFFLKADVAEALIDIGYYFSAEPLIAELENEGDGAYVPYYLRLKIFENSGKFIEGMGYFIKVPAKFPDHLGVILHRAGIQEKAGDEIGGIRSLESALALAQSRYDDVRAMDAMLYEKVNLNLRNRLWPEAITLIKENEEFIPEHFHPLWTAAWTSLIAPEGTELPDFTGKLSELIGDNPRRLALMGQLYALVDSTDKAMEFFNEAIDADRFNLDALVGKSQILDEQGKTSEAIELLESSGDYIIFNRRIFPLLISLYQKSGNYQEAMELADRLIERGQHDINRYNIAADLALSRDKKQAARSYAEKCLTENPDNPSAQLMAGNILIKIGDYKKAQELFREAVEADTAFPDAYYHLGRSCERMGNIDSAEICYRKAISFNPQYGEAYGALAGLLVDRDGENLGQISNYVRRAMKFSTNPDYHLIMGRIQQKQGRLRAASRNFGLALEKNPDHPEYNFYAGMNYINVDSLRKAKSLLRKAIDNGLSGPLRDKAREALKEL
jgi:tetratricopeptide (TPR) repeat protein